MAPDVETLAAWIADAVMSAEDAKLRYVIAQNVDGRLHIWGHYATRQAAERAAVRIPIEGPCKVLSTKPVPR